MTTFAPSPYDNMYHPDADPRSAVCGGIRITRHNFHRWYQRQGRLRWEQPEYDDVVGYVMHLIAQRAGAPGVAIAQRSSWSDTHTTWEITPGRWHAPTRSWGLYRPVLWTEYPGEIDAALDMIGWV